MLGHPPTDPSVPLAQISQMPSTPLGNYLQAQLSSAHMEWQYRFFGYWVSSGSTAIHTVILDANKQAVYLNLPLLWQGGQGGQIAGIQNPQPLIQNYIQTKYGAYPPPTVNLIQASIDQVNALANLQAYESLAAALKNNPSYGTAAHWNDLVNSAIQIMQVNAVTGKGLNVGSANAVTVQLLQALLNHPPAGI